MKFDFLLKRAMTILRSIGFIGLLKIGANYFWNFGHFLWQDMRWFIFIRKAGKYPIVTTAYGKRMRVHLHDKGISRELAIYHVHEPLGTQLINELIKEGMVILDIGANIGYYVLMESSLVGPRGQVIAIEPMPDNVELLNANLKLNDIQNVTVIQAAISDSDGKDNMYLSQSSNLCSLMKNASWDPSMGVKEVTTWKVDTLIEKMQLPVNLVRMDIEGGEVSAFEGMDHILKKYKPYIVMEMHTSIVGKQKIIEMLNSLKNYGYDVTSVIDRDRDIPWNRSGKGVRKISIDALIADKYTIDSERIVSVFLQMTKDGK